MKFDEVFFEGEERENFYISPMMKRAWAAQLELLQELDEICVRHNIQYFADWGTLLGAVRHHGYIPWDDDLDIGMKRLDYERFLNILLREYADKYDIMTSKNSPNWKGTFSRVSNAKEIPLTDEKMQRYHGFPYAAGIDFFPIDYVPVNKEEEEALLILFRAAYTLAMDWTKDEMSDEEKKESLRIVEECCNVKFDDDKPYQQQLWNLANRIASMYWDTGEIAKEVTLMYKLADEPDFRLPASCFEATVRVPFENITIPIPIGYEQILIAYYGENYMTPVRGGAEHEYPYYKKQQKLLFEYYEKNGIEIPEYLLENR